MCELKNEMKEKKRFEEEEEMRDEDLIEGSRENPFEYLKLPLKKICLGLMWEIVGSDGHFVKIVDFPFFVREKFQGLIHQFD